MRSVSVSGRRTHTTLLSAFFCAYGAKSIGGNVPTKMESLTEMDKRSRNKFVPTKMESFIKMDEGSRNEFVPTKMESLTEMNEKFQNEFVPTELSEIEMTQLIDFYTAQWYRMKRCEYALLSRPELEQLATELNDAKLMLYLDLVCLFNAARRESPKDFKMSIGPIDVTKIEQELGVGKSGVMQEVLVGTDARIVVLIRELLGHYPLHIEMFNKENMRTLSEAICWLESEDRKYTESRFDGYSEEKIIDDENIEEKKMGEYIIEKFKNLKLVLLGGEDDDDLVPVEFDDN